MKTSYSDNNDTSTSTDNVNGATPKKRDKVCNKGKVREIQTPLHHPFRSAKQVEEENLDEEEKKNNNKSAATVTPFKNSYKHTGIDDGFYETTEQDAEMHEPEPKTSDETVIPTETSKEDKEEENKDTTEVNKLKKNTDKEKENKEKEEKEKELEKKEEKEKERNEKEKENEKEQEDEKEHGNEKEKENEKEEKEKEKRKWKENNYENGNGLQKQPLMLFNEYRKDDGTVATWETMSEKQWESWDLDNPPGENHKFWLLDAKIIINMLYNIGSTRT